MRPILVRMLEGRVGSTLVMQLLGTSPDVCFDRIYPFENSYLTYLVRLTGQIRSGASEGNRMTEFLYGGAPGLPPLPFVPVGLDPQVLALRSLQGTWAALDRSCRDGSGRASRYYAEKFWGDVAPIIDAGLEPIVIDLVRDPRDVVASVRSFDAKLGRPSSGRAPGDDERASLRRLVVGMSFRFREFGDPLDATRLTIRYEDLVADLAGQADRIGLALGLRLDPDAVRAALPGMAAHMTSASVDASVGRWQRDLSPEDVTTVEHRLGAPMQRLGYHLSESTSLPVDDATASP